MPARRRRPVAAVAVAALLAVAPFALGAKVVLKDGREFTGTILEETPTSIKMKVEIAGITTEMTFRKVEIRTLDREAGAEEPAGERETRRDRGRSLKADAPSPSPEPALGGTKYLEIPITGHIGFDPENPDGPAVIADGVRECLEYAAKSGVEHVIL